MTRRVNGGAASRPTKRKSKKRVCNCLHCATAGKHGGLNDVGTREDFACFIARFTLKYFIRTLMSDKHCSLLVE